MIATLLPFLFAHKRAVGVGVALGACGLATWAGVHRYRDAQIERGRMEVRAQQLDSMLHVAQQQTARVDTVREVAVQRFTQTVTQWKYDTVRLQILAQPDTARVEVSQYRRLSSALDSVVAGANVALAAADSSTAQERREKLLWRSKAERLVPTIVRPPEHTWKRRTEGALVGALVGVVLYAAVTK